MWNAPDNQPGARATGLRPTPAARAPGRSDFLKLTPHDMTTALDVYDNPLIGRYASAEMAERWGPLRKFRTWRRLWLALAEAEAELGLLADDGTSPRIRPEQLAELRAHLDDVDLTRAAAHEKRLRHDVMAHIHALGDVAPGVRDVVHLGATSCYVTDNADLILIRE